MISYSPRAAKALALLKRHYNDVDIFVEDTGNHNMWLLIARQLLPKGTRLSSVSMLGGRNAVIAACKLDQTNTGRKKLYIIDGDLDFLLGKNKPNLKYLYRIRAYNIENLLLSENALIQIGLEAKPMYDERKIQNILNYKTLLRSVEDSLTALFVAYATAFATDKSIKTVGHPVRSLIRDSQAGATLCDIKSGARTISVYKQTVASSSLAETRAIRDKIFERVRNLYFNQIVSGKDYLLPLILFPFRARCGYRHADEQFKVALARNFDPKVEPYFARRLRNISA